MENPWKNMKNPLNIHHLLPRGLDGRRPPGRAPQHQAPLTVPDVADGRQNAQARRQPEVAADVRAQRPLLAVQRHVHHQLEGQVGVLPRPILQAFI